MGRLSLEYLHEDFRGFSLCTQVDCDLWMFRVSDYKIPWELDRWTQCFTSTLTLHIHQVYSNNSIAKLYHVKIIYVTMKILLITKVILLSYLSCVMADRLNLTRILERSLPQQLRVSRHLQELPSSNYFVDIVYLPEEDYDEDFERREQELQQLERNDRNLMPEYRNLCEIKTRKVQLNDADFEYQPPHYHEVFCKAYSFLEDEPAVKPSKQKCAHPGFHCVQRSRTLFLVRRPWDSDCWEPFTKEIASGCDCMWPVATLGDITAHY